MAEQKGFFLYLDQYKPISRLTRAQKGELLEAMFAHNSGEPFEFSDPLVEMAFGFFEQTFERDKQRYEDKCAKMRDNAAKKQLVAEGSKSNQLHTDATKSTQQQEQKQEQEQENLEESSLREDAGTKVPPCPHQQILDMYHELLPVLPRMKVWDKARKGNLGARWKERWEAKAFSSQAEGLDYFRRMFEYVGRECDFLMGRVTDRDGKPFFATLDWIAMPKNFAKVIEGKYSRREAA